MHSYTVAVLIATLCLLHTPYSDCLFDIESLLGVTPGDEKNPDKHKSLLSDLAHLFHGRHTNPSGELEKDLFNIFRDGHHGRNTGELKSSGKETSLTELIEGSQKGSWSPNVNSQSPQGLKLSDVFGLKSVLDKLQNRKSSHEGTLGHVITDIINKNDEKNELIDYVHNTEPTVVNDISVIIVEEQDTTQTTTPPPIVTIDTEVITTKANFENCLKTKNCNLFNIQGLLSKIFNLHPSHTESTQEPTTTQKLHEEKSQLFPMLNFGILFPKSVPTNAVPVVDEDSAANTNTNIFGGCGKKKGDSQRSCGLNLFNTSGLLSKLLNLKPFYNAPEKDTDSPSLESQLFPIQNVPTKISNIIPKFDFQEFLPAITKIFPDFHKSQNEQEQNGHEPNSFIEKSLNAVSDVFHHTDQKKDGDKSNAFSKSFDDMKSLLQNFNKIK